MRDAAPALLRELELLQARLQFLNQPVLFEAALSELLELLAQLDGALIGGKREQR